MRTILQDRKGNMWLASNEGMIRYDGQSFTNLTANLTSDRFFAVIEDRNGNFWFGTYGSGVYYYNGQSFQYLTTQQGLANNQVSTIYEDRTGTVWFGGNGAVSHYDGKSFRNFTIEGGYPTNDVWRYDGTTFSQVIPHPVFRVYEDKKGNLWTNSPIDTGGFGLFRYEKKSLSATTITGTEIARSLNLFGLLEARDGTIWFGAYDGVYRYNGKTVTDFKRKEDQK